MKIANVLTTTVPEQNYLACVGTNNIKDQRKDLQFTVNASNVTSIVPASNTDAASNTFRTNILSVRVLASGKKKKRVLDKAQISIQGEITENNLHL